jgi:hypothetical protein
LNDGPSGQTPAPAPLRFGAGVDDAVILPLTLTAVASRKLFDAALSLLIHILDYAFPLVLQLARVPLSIARLVGDGIAALLRGVVRFLPMAGARRDAWRDLVARQWAWLRRKISYKAFEEAVHHAFESGMAWVFRKCRALTPGGALLVLTVAVVWFPVSFAAATGLHAVLFAQAATLPPWMQLLHPVATIIAKSKLLVLPVYPAAWPQAKRHGALQASFRFGQFIATRHVARKSGYRYGQVARLADDAGAALARAAERIGLVAACRWALARINDGAAWIGRVARAGGERAGRAAHAVPLVGRIVDHYAAYHEAAARDTGEKLSQRVSGFFARWSVKFTAEYYEAKERGDAGAGNTPSPAVERRPTI